MSLITLVDLFIVHYLVLLKSDHRGEDFVTDIACLTSARHMLLLVIFQSILAFEFLFALKTR
jgi:hypothetical protein